MLIHINGQTVCLDTGNLPKYQEDNLGPSFWLSGRKYITYQDGDMLYMSVFDTDIVHVWQACDKIGLNYEERIISAGFTRIDEDNLEAYGYSSSLKKRSLPLDSLILEKFVHCLEAKPLDTKFKARNRK